MCTCTIYYLHVAGYDMFRPILAIFRYIISTGIPSVYSNYNGSVVSV
jgi:hypothetical protein